MLRCGDGSEPGRGAQRALLSLVPRASCGTKPNRSGTLRLLSGSLNVVPAASQFAPFNHRTCHRYKKTLLRFLAVQMATRRSELAPLKRSRKQMQTKQGDRGQHPQGVSKAKPQTPLRRSARLNPESGNRSGQQHPPSAKKATNRSTTSRPTSSKQPPEAEELSADIVNVPSPRSPQASASLAAPSRPAGREAELASRAPINPVDYWRREHRWPKEYFEPGIMSHLRPRKRSTPSPISTTSTDQKPGESSASYHGSRFIISFQAKGSFMQNSDLGITENSRAMCLDLLRAEQTVPAESLFRDDIFRRTCQNIEDRNEARIVQDITRLIVPSAETFATFGARSLEVLAESVNEGWVHSIPLTRTRPQPDYSVGFKPKAFSKEQLKKLAPFIGDLVDGDQSFFMATQYMYFPFLACEVKGTTAGLAIADRQNAHSMTLAGRAIVEIFKLVKRQKEIDREILAFSVSHDHQNVRIFGHYPVITKEETTFYRYLIHSFDFTALDGREKWTAYKFVKNVYETWMPMHLDRIRSVVDELPFDFDFDNPPLPEKSESSPSERRNQSGIADAGSAVPNTSPEKNCDK
ncbi:hypothetical protein BDY21DRAFT_157141 [Lineolata rhizophorae]|uniref:DUF7924 domain-containing protein n=1 Tax=Lineolata rhizophorae TaxID=578093 RepID=A0A6A6NLJ7_9PEZI|nr:hypothetical protein BDY21DRAFT_157141 [Lineolata rhizophorae]